MHPRFLHLLCCPETRRPLALHSDDVGPDGSVITGRLRTACGRSYPVVRGVPRFVGREQYASSFGWEWSRWPRVQFEAENAGRPMAGHTTRMWERICGVTDADAAGKTVVDFGCGPGRFLDVVRRKGGIAVGIDLSRAVDAARSNFADDPNVLIVQGDLLRPPFRDAVFDAGFSVGVLHHTPDPAAGLRRLAQTVRPGGWVSCCVYPKGGFYDFPSVRRFRGLNRRLAPALGYRAALGYSHLAARAVAPAFRSLKKVGLRRTAQWLERNWVVSLDLKDPRWRVLDVFDAITPEIASTHTEEEVAAWMAEAGCVAVRRTDWCATSAAGVRSRTKVDALEPGQPPVPSPLYPGERARVRGSSPFAQCTAP